MYVSDKNNSTKCILIYVCCINESKYQIQITKIYSVSVEYTSINIYYYL